MKWAVTHKRMSTRDKKWYLNINNTVTSAMRAVYWTPSFTVACVTDDRDLAVKLARFAGGIVCEISDPPQKEISQEPPIVNPFTGRRSWL